MIGMVHFGAMYTTEPTEQQQFGIEFKKMLTWDTNGITDAAVQANEEAGTITINKIGTYNINLSCSFKGTNEREYELAVFQDGVIVPQLATQRFQQKNLVTRGTVCGGIVDVISVPSVFDVRCKCDIDDANVMIVENATLSCIQIINTDISCKVTKSTNQTISDDIDTIIDWDQETYDTDDMHDNVTNNSRITIKTAGKYTVMAQIAWTSNSVGMRDIQILKNGVVLGNVRYLPSNNSRNIISAVDEFVVDDFLELQVNQDSGVSLDFRFGIAYFTATRLTT